jgi:predicted dehydrogenase
VSVGIAVVGTGNAGFEHLLAARDTPGARVQAIVDVDRDRAERAARELGIDCPVHTRLEDALADDGVEAVVVASPSDLHEGQTIEAARAGRHVLLEKPAALSSEGLDRMLAAVEASGVLCQVDMILRWHPMIEAIVAARDRGDLGDVFCVEADFVFGELEGSEPDWARGVAQGGSVHLYAGCHPYDQLGWLMGSPIVEVAAASTRRSLRWEYDVTAIALVRFANGGIGRATTTLEAAAPYRFGVRVFGTAGTVVDNAICTPASGHDFRELCPERVDVTYLPFDRVMADFVGNVAARRDSHASLAATADLFRLALDAERAADGHLAVGRT